MNCYRNLYINDFCLWEKIIQLNNEIDVFFLPNYAKAFEINKDGLLQVIIYYEPENKFLIFPYFLREIIETPYFDIITPYGYGGFYSKNINSNEIGAIISHIQKYFLYNNVISLFIRFHLFESNIAHFNGRKRNPNDVLFVNTEQPIDKIIEEYDRSVRKNLNKAIRNNIFVKIDINKQCILEFYEIYLDTMKRNNSRPYYYFSIEFFQNLISFLPNNTLLIHSYSQDKIVSTELVLFGKNFAYSFLGGSDSKYLEWRVNDILKHEIIKWCCEHKIKKFILGGGYTKNDGIFSYKQKFTKQTPLEFFVGEKILNEPIYNELVSNKYLSLGLTEQEINSIEFFPKYRYTI